MFILNNPSAIPSWMDAKIIAAPNNYYDLLRQECAGIERHCNKVNAKNGTLLASIWRYPIDMV